MQLITNLLIDNKNFDIVWIKIRKCYCDNFRRLVDKQSLFVQATTWSLY